jgi:hypothetical protein
MGGNRLNVGMVTGGGNRSGVEAVTRRKPVNASNRSTCQDAGVVAKG